MASDAAFSGAVIVEITSTVLQPRPLLSMNASAQPSNHNLDLENAAGQPSSWPMVGCTPCTAQ